MSFPLLIVGASVRATAQSARRAGFAPLAIDLFADVDLQEIAQTRRCERYPDDLPNLASELPDAPFLYTGALENSPEILKELQSVRPLWGNGEEQLRLVRDPVWVQEVLSQAGFPSVPTRRTPPVRSETRCWLRKPLASAAGLGIDFDSTASRTTDVYWQRFIPGVPISTLYIADDRSCQMIGTARQWVGWPEFPVGPFQFCGAIVPARISVAIRRDLELIGTRFAESAGLRGLFGIDLIQQEGRVYLVEINPRPTATMELYERIYDRSFLEDHANVFRGIERPRIFPSGEIRSAAKMILYAPQSGQTPALEFWNELNGNSIYPSVADLPAAGQSLEIGQPVCTILADGIGETVVLDALLKTTERIARELGWPADFRRFLKDSKLG